MEVMKEEMAQEVDKEEVVKVVKVVAVEEEVWCS